MNKGASTILYPVSSLNRAKTIFTSLLGVEPIVDKSYYVGYQVAGQQIGLDPNGASRGIVGGTPFWEVDDIRDSVAALVRAGATVVEDVRDVGGGRQIAILKDSDGNTIGVSQTAQG